MNSNRKAAVIVGVLFISGTLMGVLSVVFTSPIFNDPEFLSRVVTDPNQVSFGALCILSMGLTLAMIPVVIYPILKPYSQPLAIGYLVFRGGLETLCAVVVAICWLLLIPLSQELGKAGAPDSAVLYSMGMLLRKAADTSSSVMAVVFPLGAIMLYWVLYQGKLIPRWLSIWGLIGVGLHLIFTGLAGLFNLADPLSLLNTLSNLPIFLQEMVMAVWLIARGFSAPVGHAKPVGRHAVIGH